MATWANRRRNRYLLGILAVLLIVGAGIYFGFFYETPMCTDGVQNGDESGIDCGGSCTRLCTAEASQPALLWSRSFAVTNDVYNTVAYLDNANLDVVSGEVSYIFRLFDDRNILIAERSGVTRIARTGVVPVFEGGIQTGNRTPARTFFEFDDAVSWEKLPRELPHLTIRDRSLTGASTTPRVRATLSNESTIDAFDIEVVAVVFDSSGNALNASRTVVPLLEGRSSTELTFTWPRPFSRAVSQIDIIPRVLPR